VLHHALLVAGIPYVVIGGEQGDQGDHDAGECLDQAPAIEAAAAAGLEQ
jgi:hypothetical protein